jgi:hypothetical protein
VAVVSDPRLEMHSVRSSYNEMLFDGVSDGFDYLDLSRRSLNRLDFRLTDSYGNIIDFKKIIGAYR